MLSKSQLILGLLLIGCSQGLLAHGTHITDNQHTNIFTHLFLDHPWIIALAVAAILVLRKLPARIK